MASPLSSHGQKLLSFIFSLAIILQWNMSRSERLIGPKPMVERYERWLAKHRKSYADDREKQTRFVTYQTNVAYIEAFNAVPGRTYYLSDNQFADMTISEYRTTYLGYKDGSDNSPAKIPGFIYENVTAPPESIDWRKNGAVAPVKNQGNCGN